MHRSFKTTVIVNIILVVINAVILVELQKHNNLTVATVLTTVAIIDLLMALNVFHAVVKPSLDIWKAVKDIDFNKSCVDFSKVDNLKLTGSYEMQQIIVKVKYLISAFSDRVLTLNSVSFESEHDQLTNCYNRLHLEKVKAAYETAENFYVLFCDVNNLKRMNDEFGHEAGDALLKHASEKLSFWSTYGDVYRVGGDEFIVVVTDANRRSFDYTVEKWYKRVGQLNRDTDGFKCVIALGVAYGSTGDDFDTVEKQADERMYVNKLAIKKANGEPLSREDAVLLENAKGA